MNRRKLLVGTAALTIAGVISETAFGAVGDISAVAVNAEGWTVDVTVLGFHAGGTLTLNPDTASPYVRLTVVGSGFDATGAASTPTRTVIATAFKRQPYANQTLRVETYSGGNDTITLALSDRVYPGDTVTADITAGFLIDDGAGGGSTASNALSNFSATNNSTSACVQPIANWVTPQNQRATADFVVELAVAHRYGQLGRMAAAVKFVATGQTSVHVENVTVTVMTASAVATRTGLSVPVFSGTIPIAGFTQNEQIKVDCIVYPFVGPALQASVDGVVYPTPDLTQLNVTCDKGSTYSGAIAYTDIVNGNDSTGVINDPAHKYKTIGKSLVAIAAWNNSNKSRNTIDGGTVLLQAGTYASFGPTDPSGLAGGTTWCEIKPDAGVTKASVIYNMADTTNIFICSGLKWSNMTFSSTGSNTFGFRGSGATSNQQTWFNGCDLVGDGTTTAPFFQNGYQTFTNCLIQNMGKDVTLYPFSNNRQVAQLVVGCEVDSCGIHELASAFGNYYYGTGPTYCVMSGNATLTNLPARTQSMMLSTKTLGLTGQTILPWSNVNQSATRGVVFVQNVVEVTTAVEGQSAVQISADSDVDVCPNVVIAYNTVAGARINYIYNDIGTTAIAKDGVDRFNLWANFNIKRDTFLPGNSNRVGDWSVSYHVGSRGSANQTGSKNGSTPGPDAWEGEYLGINGLASNNLGTSNPFKYVHDYASIAYGGSGAGGGDYHLQVGSAAIGLVPLGLAMLPLDIVGLARSNSGKGAAGAYEFPSSNSGLTTLGAG